MNIGTVVRILEVQPASIPMEGPPATTPHPASAPAPEQLPLSVPAGAPAEE